MNKQKKINLASAWEKVGMPFVLLVLIIFMLINAPNFGTVSNLFNVARSISISAILAAGMTLVIITTGIDLSVGSTIAVSGCVAVLAARAGLNPILAVILGMFIGAVIGLILQACSIHCDVGYDDVYARIGLHDNWWPTYC